MRFWDSSAVTPLLIDEAESEMREQQLRGDPVMVVWYGTLTEIESALNLRRREGSLDRANEKLARRRLDLLTEGWNEVQPLVAVRDRAVRLLRTHPLRAADAFQLAAALILCEERPEGVSFLTGDQRLAEAAGAEGFSVG